MITGTPTLVAQAGLKGDESQNLAINLVARNIRRLRLKESPRLGTDHVIVSCGGSSPRADRAPIKKQAREKWGLLKRGNISKQKHAKQQQATADQTTTLFDPKMQKTDTVANDRWYYSFRPRIRRAQIRGWALGVEHAETGGKRGTHR